jgi:hypothetical protein
MIKRKSMVLNTSEFMFIQTTLATAAHLAGGQCLLEEQTLNIEKSAIYRVGTRRRTVSKREEQNLEPR